MKKEKTFKRRTEKSQTQNTCKRMLIIYTCEKPQRAEVYHLSRCGSERIAEEEEEEIERNVKEFSSAKSATFFSSAFSRQTRLSRTQSKEDYKSFRAVSEGLCFSETEPLRSVLRSLLSLEAA